MLIFRSILIFILLFLSNNLFAQNIDKPLNFIVIFADDLGYGDLSSFGNPTINTPNLDKMVSEGQKWTQFYAGSSVCTPSRAALLTGRLAVRNGMTSSKARVLFPDSKNGLPDYEITIAEQLKKVKYRTACIGKWHLGHKKEHLPLKHGFDYYYGIPYSNDMDVPEDIMRKKGGYNNFMSNPENYIIENFQVPLIQNEKVIELPANQNNITRRYSEETIRFIKENNDNSFFIYLAHNLPHIPLFASKDALGKSSRGLYGDVIEEIDYGIGEILKTLKHEGLDKNTLVVFTSDNGPWTAYKDNGGSAGPLRAGKGTTWEGGMRVPTIFWLPGIISPGIINQIGSTMDLFTTFSKIAGVPIPKDRQLDSYDLGPRLFENNPSSRNHIFYYRGNELYAVRFGEYKAHYITQGEYGLYGGKKIHNPPLLYNLNKDASEKYDISKEYPDVIKKINRIVTEHKQKMIIGKDLLIERGD